MKSDRMLELRVLTGVHAGASALLAAHPQWVGSDEDCALILTDTGVEAVANLERVQTPALAVPQKYNNNAQQWWWGVAEENSRVYTRRVVINAEPL